MNLYDLLGLKPRWDRRKAAKLLGRTILIGLTYRPGGGQPEELSQIHGTIEEADEKGILVRLAGARAGETYTLPPHLSALKKASPGVYRLRSTGEEVVDPDLVTSWVVERSDTASA